MEGYNFTERVRKVLQMSREAAQKLRHEYVGTEHILLGILHEGEGVAALTLQNLGVDPDALEADVQNVVKKGRTPVGFDLPFTSRAKKVLELAMRESREQGHKWVGTEHLLLGILREEKGIAAQTLFNTGVTLDKTRGESLKIISSDERHTRKSDQQHPAHSGEHLRQDDEGLRLIISLKDKLISIAGVISNELGMSLTPEKIRALCEDPDLKKKIMRALGGGEYYSS